MTREQLSEVPPKVTRWIREQIGWSRPRLSFMLMQREDADPKTDSVKRLERYETSDVAQPEQVRRYRETLGPEIFDVFLERARREMPKLFEPQNSMN